MQQGPVPPQQPVLAADAELGIGAAVRPMAPHGAVFRRMGRNLGWLLGGRGFQAVASLGYLAAAARGLGPAAFGVFTLVLAYAQGIANLVQFQSWQAVIRYGALHRAEGRPDRLARLVGFTAMLDGAGALAGVAIAMAAAGLAAGLLGWSPDQARAALLFTAAMLLSVGVTPSGVLRLYDRYDLLTYGEAIGPFVRLAGALAAFAAGSGIRSFLAVWAGAALLQSAAQWGAALAASRVRPSFGRRAFRQTVAENGRLWRFMIQTNLSASLGLVGTQVGLLAVGAAAGPTAAGGLRIAAKLAKAVARPAQVATRVLYPELARLAAAGDVATLAAVARRVTFGAVALGLALVAALALAGRPFLAAFGGHGFAFARPYLLVFGISAAIDLSGLALEPIQTAFGKSGRVLRARGAGAAAYLASLAALLPALGPVGAAWAAVAGSAVTRTRLAAVTARLLSRPSAPPAGSA